MNSHRRAPVMTDDDRFFLPEGMDQTDYVSNQLENIVGFNGFRTIGFSVPPLVRSNSVIPRFSQGRKLMPPGVPQFRKSMAHNDQGAFSLLGNLHLDAVGFNNTLSTLHLFSLSLWVNGKRDYRLEIAIKPVVPFSYLSLG